MHHNKRPKPSKCTINGIIIAMLKPQDLIIPPSLHEGSMSTNILMIGERIDVALML